LSELVSGWVENGFEGVREAFAENLRSGAELGATFAVVRHGQPVVDLWGGFDAPDRQHPLDRDALFTLWSTTKGLSAIAIAMLVDRGKLDYETPVATWWPDFAAGGKSNVTLGELMSHQAGLCGADQPVSIEDFLGHSRVAEVLAAQTPFFEPGTAWGYHALTIGILADELVRRADGRSIGAFFADEVAGPLGIDAYLGLPESEDGRHVAIIPPALLSAPDTESPNMRARDAVRSNPPLNPGWTDRRDWRAAGLSSAGGVSNARSLARLYGALAAGGEIDGVRLLSPGSITAAVRERICGPDQVEGTPGRYAAGFRLNINEIMGPGQSAYGHPGWGGSVAFADPDAGIGAAYVMSQMQAYAPGDDPRVNRLLAATYAALNR